MTEISVHFKQVPHALLAAGRGPSSPTCWPSASSPTRASACASWRRCPGPTMTLRPVTMDFRYGVDLRRQRPRGLRAAHPGRDARAIRRCSPAPTRSARRGASSRPSCEAWATARPTEFPNYPAGTWGPAEADDLIERDGRALEAAMRLSVDQVEREIARLWEQEARTGRRRARGAAHAGGAGQRAAAARARADGASPSWSQACTLAHGRRRCGETATRRRITADVALHRAGAGRRAPAGTRSRLEAVGGAREWLPGNVDRLALPDLPVCVWWVGDLPDYDDLFDRMVVDADVGHRQLGRRWICATSRSCRASSRAPGIATPGRPRRGSACAACRSSSRGSSTMQQGRACLPGLQRDDHRVLAPRRRDRTRRARRRACSSGGWRTCWSCRPTSPQWKRGDGWAEVQLGRVVARFEQGAQQTCARAGSSA